VLNALVPKARGEVVLLSDVRQKFDSRVLRVLVQSFADPQVGAVSAEVILTRREDGTAVSEGSGFYWRYENWTRLQESRFRGGVDMTDPIAMIRWADVTPPPEDLILDDVCIPMRLGLAGKRIAFVPEAEAHDAAFEDDREFRCKARTLVGNYQLFARLPALLSPFSNRICFETISHKICRLAAPWLLLLLAFASVMEAWRDAIPATGFLVAGQLAFYTVAVTAINSYRFVISGNVERPGVYSANHYVTVSEAMALAGGPNKFADPGAMVIIRGDASGAVRRIPVDYPGVIAGTHPKENLCKLTRATG